MKKHTIENATLTGERAAYASIDCEFNGCIFEDGESPLKESRNITVNRCEFGWKYPLWYCKGVSVNDTEWKVTGRSGVWYTNDINIADCKIDAPKQFRKCSGVTVVRSDMPHAEETMWDCRNVAIEDCAVTGDYFGMNCENVVLKNVRIDGNYCFDGAKNVEARGCVFDSKDAFWNCENVIVYDSVITGEFLAWNTKNITLVNCEIESHQGFCYIEKPTLDGCLLKNSDLCFELCSDIDADIAIENVSIKNPISGVIRYLGQAEIISDANVIDPAMTSIEVKK